MKTSVVQPKLKRAKPRNLMITFIVLICILAILLCEMLYVKKLVFKILLLLLGLVLLAFLRYEKGNFKNVVH